VGEHPVEADGHPEAADEVHDERQHQVVDPDDLVPEDDDRRDDDQRREHDGEQVRDLRRTRHGLSVRHRIAAFLDADIRVRAVDL
jgi:hypothetical protein